MIVVIYYLLSFIEVLSIWGVKNKIFVKDNLSLFLNKSCKYNFKNF